MPYATEMPVEDAIDLLRETGGRIAHDEVTNRGWGAGRCVTLRRWLDSRGLARYTASAPARLLVSVEVAIRALREFGRTLTREEIDRYRHAHRQRYRLLHDPHGNLRPGTILEACVVETYLEESAIRRNQQTADDWRCVQGLEFESLDGDERFRIYDGQKLEVANG